MAYDTTKPDITNVMKNSKSKGNVQQLFDYYKAAEVCTHYKHLITDSYARHEALGDFYTSLQSLNDSLAEKLIRNNEQKLTLPSSISLTKEDEVAYISKIGTYTDQQIQAYKDQPDIQDILIDIKNLINQTLYMFKLS